MEYITANGTKYECKEVTTSTDSISFSMEGQEIKTIREAFKEVTDLTVSGEDGDAYGAYTGLIFESATVYADGAILIVMHIKSEIELRFDELEASQEEQDEMIAALMFGGDE